MKSKNVNFFLLVKICFGLMTIVDCALLGQSASGLNFYDDSGRSPLAD